VTSRSSAGTSAKRGPPRPSVGSWKSSGPRPGRWNTHSCFMRPTVLASMHRTKISSTAGSPADVRSSCRDNSCRICAQNCPSFKKATLRKHLAARQLAIFAGQFLSHMRAELSRRKKSPPAQQGRRSGRSNAGGAGFNQGQGGLDAPDAAARLHPELRSDRLAKQLHLFHRGGRAITG